jgi:hypothetical protein
MTDQSQPAAAQPTVVASPQPSGIGGWLILPMLGLIASAGSQVLSLPDMFTTFGQLSVSGVGGLASNLVQLDMLVSLGVYLIAPVALLVLLFNKKRSFPRNFIRWAVVAAIFVVFDIFLGYWLSHAALEAQGASFFDYGLLKEVLGPIAALCIWTPYMLNSVRVKNTFVK